MELSDTPPLVRDAPGASGRRGRGYRDEGGALGLTVRGTSVGAALLVLVLNGGYAGTGASDSQVGRRYLLEEANR